MAGVRGSGARERVLVAGGGIAGVEALLALRDLAGDRVDSHLHSTSGEFVFRPYAVGEPYGAARALHYDLGRLCERCRATFHRDGIEAVDPGRKLVVTGSGERQAYDHLLLAPGARMRPAVPGAVTFWATPEQDEVREAIARLREGALRRIAFTTTEGRGWSLPLYELALLAATERGRSPHARTEIVVVTPEARPLEAFGPRAAEQVGELLRERGIDLIASSRPVEFSGGLLALDSGEEIEADVAIAQPSLEGRRIEGVPSDARGFVPVDEHSRAIGLEDVYVAGDASSFPLKQGGIAAQQADAAVEAIAAAAGAEVDPRPFEPVLRAVLWTGEGARYLYGRHREGGGESGMGERPRDGLRGGKVVARYLAPFVEEASAEIDAGPASFPGPGAGPAA